MSNIYEELKEHIGNFAVLESIGKVDMNFKNFDKNFNGDDEDRYFNWNKEVRQIDDMFYVLNDSSKTVCNKLTLADCIAIALVQNYER